MTKKIAIIGGGATGTLLAVNLLKFASNPPVEINIIEKNIRLGAGVAYSSPENFHLLNVPANKMGAFPDDVEHFYKWLQTNLYYYSPNDFVPRKLYGEYLSDVFETESIHKSVNTKVNFFSDEAIDIDVENNGVKVILESGKVVESDKVVLAFGNFLPSHPNLPNTDFVNAEKYTQNPWNATFYDKLSPNDEILLIGTGLTMFDTALSLYYRKHKGKITAVSRHGLLPAVHKLGFSYPSFSEETLSETKVSALLKIIRRHIKKSEVNSDWRAVIDSLRPVTQKVWLNLSQKEKARFLRHLSHYWNVARHRVPNQCAEILKAMEFAGRLEIDRGKISRIEIQENGKFSVDYGNKTVCADAIINVTGSQTNFRRLDVKIIKNLLNKGVITPDSLSIGLNALPTGEIIDSSGNVNEKIYTIGTALKGILWESTAMPELRAQAKELAMRFLQNAEVAGVRS